MKTTKVFLFSLFLLAAVSVNAQRDAPRDPADRAEQQTEHLTTVLDLTPEQTAKVQAINLAYAERAEAGRKTTDAAKEAHQSAIKAVLTAEQASKFDALEAQRRERGEGRKDRKGGKPDRG